MKVGFSSLPLLSVTCLTPPPVSPSSPPLRPWRSRKRKWSLLGKDDWNPDCIDCILLKSPIIFFVKYVVAHVQLCGWAAVCSVTLNQWHVPYIRHVYWTVQCKPILHKTTDQVQIKPAQRTRGNSSHDLLPQLTAVTYFSSKYLLIQHWVSSVVVSCVAAKSTHQGLSRW